MDRGNSARAEPALQQQHRTEEGDDQQDLSGTAALDRGAKDEERERRREHQPRGESEGPARAQADGGSGSPRPGAVGRWPMIRRFTQASGS